MVIEGLKPDKTYEVSLKAYVTVIDSEERYCETIKEYVKGEVNYYGADSDKVVSGKILSDEAETSTKSSGSSKKANPMKLTITEKTYRHSRLTKKKTFSIGVKKAKGKVTYKLSKKAKKAKIKVSKKGKVTVPKKCRIGSYKITVKAAGTSSYKSASKKVTVRIK